MPSGTFRYVRIEYLASHNCSIPVICSFICIHFHAFEMRLVKITSLIVPCMCMQ